MLADCGVTTWGHADMSLYRLYGFERKDPANRQAKQDFWTREYFHQRRRNFWIAAVFFLLFAVGLALLLKGLGQ